VYAEGARLERGCPNWRSRPDRCPDGRLPVMTLTTSRWGAAADQPLLPRTAGAISIAGRQARTNDRGARIVALRPSLPHARHRAPWRPVFDALSVSDSRIGVNGIYRASSACRCRRYAVGPGLTRPLRAARRPAGPRRDRGTGRRRPAARGGCRGRGCDRSPSRRSCRRRPRWTGGGPP